MWSKGERKSAVKNYFGGLYMVKNPRSTSIFIRHRRTGLPRSFVIKIIRLMFRALPRKLSVYTYVAVRWWDIMTLGTVRSLKYNPPLQLL